MNIKIRLKTIKEVISENLNRIRDIDMVNNKIIYLDTPDWNIVSGMMKNFGCTLKATRETDDFWELEDDRYYHKSFVAEKIEEPKYKLITDFEKFCDLVGPDVLFRLTPEGKKVKPV